jgi:hypothetical protein
LAKLHIESATAAVVPSWYYQRLKSGLEDYGEKFNNNSLDLFSHFLPQNKWFQSPTTLNLHPEK